MVDPLELPKAPELIFGIVAPIGVDFDLVIEALGNALTEMGYDSCTIRLTKEMTAIPVAVKIKDSPLIESYKTRIKYADEVCRRLGNDALAVSAVSAIRRFRVAARRTDGIRGKTPRKGLSADEKIQRPLSQQAYILRQIKRPEEVALLRRVYGRQFILISAYAPEEFRIRRLAMLERESQGGMISEPEAEAAARELVMQDAQESGDDHGQNVRDAFPLADVFIDARTRPSCEEMIRRFIRLFFGNNEITPTHEEYGMYMAKSASLRSADLSRQVGVAIFRSSGEMIALGCNEVPKAGGGTYWAGDIPDARDIILGRDPNEMHKFGVFVDVLDRLKKGKHLSDDLAAVGDATEIGKHLLNKTDVDSVAKSRIMDLIEFGRIIHAEMSAICDAARKGLSIERATLYGTTFPCHLCAKHIVAAGICRIVYIEPYPKSYATSLHEDSIVLDHEGTTEKVRFDAFIGVSPYRYRDLFEKRKRKTKDGLAQTWNQGSPRPMIDVYYPSYFAAETHAVAQMSEPLEKIKTQLRGRRRRKKTKHARR